MEKNTGLLVDDSNDDNETIANLNGITVGGVHLEKWLKNKTTDEHTRAIHQAHNEQVKIHHGKFKPSLKYDTEETKRVSKRVVYFDDQRIRREYGLMAKPYDSLAKNIIWCIAEKGPIAANDIKEIVDPDNEKTQQSFSGYLSYVWNRLGDSSAQIFEREKLQGTASFRYRKKSGIELSVDAIIEQYKLWNKKDYRENQLAERRNKFLDTLNEQEKKELLAKETLENLNKINSKYPGLNKVDINQSEVDKQQDESDFVAISKPDGKPQKNTNVGMSALQQVAQTIGININLSGRIDIKFGIDTDGK